MKHIVITRANFTDNDLFQKYLKVIKEIYFPSFSKQTCKDFEICIISNKQHKDLFLEEIKNFQLNAEVFVPETVKLYNDYIRHVKKTQYTIQTRHDCDDWASSDYIKAIQDTYLKYKDVYDDFLIQAEPLKLDFNTGLEYNTLAKEKFTSEEPSMFLTLCQKNCTKFIYQEQHRFFSKVVPNVIDLGKGYVKWVIHGNNTLGKILPQNTLA